MKKIIIIRLNIIQIFQRLKEMNKIYLVKKNKMKVLKKVMKL